MGKEEDSRKFQRSKRRTAHAPRTTGCRDLLGEREPEKPPWSEAQSLRVGGRADEALISYEARHPALLPHTHWISLLITRHFHQTGHSGVATTVVKVRKKFWILRAHDLARTVKFRCAPCQEMEARVETQFIADVPRSRLESFKPPVPLYGMGLFWPL